MKPSFILHASIAALLLLPDLHGALTDNFESVGASATAIATGGAGTLPSILDDGAGTNKFLRLLYGANGESNRYVYDQTDTGLWETITASFDFRIKPSTAGLADGFHFALIPTAQFGTAGDGPNMLAEEPNAAGTFGVGIDVYPGINNVSTHWNGYQSTEVPVPTADPLYAFRSNTVFNRLSIELQRVGNATNALITITPNSLGTPSAPYVLMNSVVSNLLPFDNRVQFGGRTGGENMFVDLDNVSVAYANTFNPGSIPDAPASAAGHLYQDFDSRGTTQYNAVIANPSSLTEQRPGPLMKAGDATSNGAFLRIVNDTVNSQNNRVVFHRAPDGGASNATEVLDFDLRFNSSDPPADGAGLLFLPTRNPGNEVYSAVGDGLGSSEEPNHPGALGIGFDIYSNGPEDPAGSLSLHWNGVKLPENYPIDPSLAINQFNHVKVIRETVADGLNVTVVGSPIVGGVQGAPITLIDRAFVAGANLYDYRVQLSARTGGLNADVDIDNLQTSQLQRAPLAQTQADFSLSSPASGWKGYAYGINAGQPAGPAPDIRTDFGVNENYLRLSTDRNNGISNSITFDQQIDGSIAGRTRIAASFSARVINADPTPAVAADGFSFILLPVATFGASGPGAAATAGFAAEEPNVAAAFGIGFDAYNGGPQFSELSVHWNGGVIANVETLSMFQFDLVNAPFMKFKIDLQQIETGTLLNLALTPDIYGAPGTDIKIFDELLIPGMSLYDYRVEFAARTGGLNLGVDIDDILVQTIPEPSSALLLALGGLLLNRRRRCVK